MAPTPARPPAGTPGSQATKAATQKGNMSSILSNVDQLFITARKGALNIGSSTYLRGAILEHHRYIIFHAIKGGKSNPLLDIPESLDPSLMPMGQPSLIPPAKWTQLITAAEAEARQKLAEGTLTAPKLEPSASTASTPASSPASTTIGVRPPSMAGRPQVRPAGATGAGSPAPSAAPSPAGTPLLAPAIIRQAPPPGVMKGDELKRWASMPAAERVEHMRNEPELKRRFEQSVNWYRGQARAKEMAAAQAQASQAQAGHSAGQNQAGPSNSQPSATLAKPNTTTTPARPPPTNTSASTIAIPTLPPTLQSSNPTPVLGNPGFTLAQPPPPRSNNALQGQGSSTSTLQSSSNFGPSGANAGSGSAGPSHPPPPLRDHHLDPALAGAYVPPPPMPPAPRRIPEEPEADRRKRKYREWTAEMGAGLEVELGLDEILNEVVDKFILDVTRAGIRLSKHRKSDKVELKDLAFYVDKQYHMTVPGFDAHVPKPLHLPVDTEERKRLRAVIPRTMKKAEEEAPAVAGAKASGTRDASAAAAKEGGAA